MAIPVCRTPDVTPRVSRPVTFRGAADCHAHLYGSEAEYPRDPARPFDPAPGSFAQYLEWYRSIHRTLGIERGVIVHSNTYGTDNRVTVDAIAALGPNYKGVALVEADVPQATLEALRQAGMVAVRLNLMAPAGFTLADAEALAPRLAELGMHLETIMPSPDALEEAAPRFAAMPVPVVLDHAARFVPAKGLDDPNFRRFLKLLENGKTWTKLSGIYRQTTDYPAMDDCMPFVERIIETNPERVVWGSDWPFVMYDGPMPNAGELLDFVRARAGDGTIERILVDNPARLYGFESH